MDVNGGKHNRQRRQRLRRNWWWLMRTTLPLLPRAPQLKCWTARSGSQLKSTMVPPSQRPPIVLHEEILAAARAPTTAFPPGSLAL